jgi:hypothetical protein
MYDPASSVPLSIGPASVKVYGKEFSFTNPRERAAAISEAKQFGRERQTTMQIQKRRPLSSREQVYGDLEAPPERTKPKVYSQPDANPDHNHWRSRADELKRQAAHTPQEKARLRNRIEFAQRMADEFDQQRMAEQELQNRPVDDDLVRLRAHAFDAYERVRADPRSTVADIVAHKKLLTMAYEPGLTPGAYWDAARSLIDPDDEVQTLGPQDATPSQVPYQHQ